MRFFGSKRLTAKLFFKQLYERYQNDGVADSAASLSYYFVFALFPFLFLLVTVTAYIPFVRTSVDTLLARARTILPPEAMALIDTHVRGLVAKPPPRLLAMVVLLTLYSASRGMDAIRKALNLAYGVTESRPLWKTEALAFGMTASGAVLILIGTAALAAGGSGGLWLAGHVGIASQYVLVWRWLRWPVTAGMIAVGAALGYYLLPDVGRRLRFITPGSAVGTLLWFLTTWAFSEYVAHFDGYNVAYGAIGGVVVLMTWFYISGFIFLVGGEINAIVEAVPRRGREAGSRFLRAP